ncbi:histidine phosphatase family protein [Enterococcus sp. LJL90]
MKKVYFVRHSIRAFKEKNDREDPLTTRGLELSEGLTNFFVDKKISKIYSSPFLRTIQTITPTSNLLDLPIIQVEDLKERAVGKWIDNFSEYSAQQWKDFSFKLENGESLRDVQNRIVRAYEKILSQKGNDIIICGHSTAFAALFHYLLKGNYGIDELSRMKMPDIFLGQYEGDKLIGLNHQVVY